MPIRLLLFSLLFPAAGLQLPSGLDGAAPVGREIAEGSGILVAKALPAGDGWALGAERALLASPCEGAELRAQGSLLSAFYEKWGTLLVGEIAEGFPLGPFRLVEDSSEAAGGLTLPRPPAGALEIKGEFPEGSSVRFLWMPATPVDEGGERPASWLEHEPIVRMLGREGRVLPRLRPGVYLYELCIPTAGGAPQSRMGTARVVPERAAWTYPEAGPPSGASFGVVASDGSPLPNAVVWTSKRSLDLWRRLDGWRGLPPSRDFTGIHFLDRHGPDDRFFLAAGADGGFLGVACEGYLPVEIPLAEALAAGSVAMSRGRLLRLRFSHREVDGPVSWSIHSGLAGLEHLHAAGVARSGEFVEVRAPADCDLEIRLVSRDQRCFARPVAERATVDPSSIRIEPIWRAVSIE